MREDFRSNRNLLCTRSRFSISWTARATQTEDKLRRENVRNKDHANRIHNEVGRKVRKIIHELGGTMPENLPVATNDHGMIAFIIGRSDLAIIAPDGTHLRRVASYSVCAACKFMTGPWRLHPRVNASP